MPGRDRRVDRELARLALPAFLALVAEPLFLIADSAIVGHLGTRQLAGLGVAAVVLQTVTGLCVFLAYGTTAAVARRVGAGDSRGALSQGIDGLWLALLIGVVVTVPCVLLAHPLVRAAGADAPVAGQGAAYLRIAALGVTPLLLMMAATGVLRGLQDTRTPMVVAILGNLLNIALNLLFVYGAGLGIRGSALGSVCAQLLAATALVAVVVRGSRGLPLRPDLAGIKQAARAGVALVVRTLTLRAALLATTFAVSRTAAGHGQATALAAHQVAFTLWTLLSFVLDAIAIAAQAITGRALGAGDRDAVRAATTRMVWWGTVVGAAGGILLAAASPLVGALFTDDAGVRHHLVPVLVIAALAEPVCGVVFVLDGVLIGAGDGRYLAIGGVLTFVVYAPVLALVVALGGGLPWVWVVFSVVFMGARFAVLTRRARGDRWLVTGVPA
ncbi:MATE family efflux transporter [Nocardioides sp. BP30]|uniref:MATE family efflux transporter n=1 Tax=Nocardioides sp. BP30 TaxID=3036374 RepID=UPI002468BC19|nr:MATE family efflux transporter [Nocardioides sp. BP30]WGL52520.1 MATE family efflux transporter [Nocardioides sp. BP30]